MTADSKLTPSQNGTKPQAAVKPRLLLAASPASGHTAPMIKLADALAQRGYEVNFLAGEDFKESIEKTGSKYLEIPSWDDEAIFGKERQSIPVGPERIMYDVGAFFIEPTKERKEILYKTLEQLKSEEPDREILVLSEPFFLGDHAMYHGAPIPNGFKTRPRNIIIHAIAYVCRSVDSGPFGLGIVPEATEEARNQYAAMNEQGLQLFAPLMARHEEVFTSLGGKNYEKKHPFDYFSTSGDVSLHMYPRSVEYPRSDWHPQAKVVGALPRVPAKQDAVFPSFWDEVTRGDKTVVAVTQGTVAIDYSQLLIPTLNSLAGREDILVVAVLGVKGAKLPAEFEVPKNARVVDYLSYDVILPYASAFVLNAGYGGFIHGVINGVPMVLAGDSEDKPEIANRGEWAGIGINLRSGAPESKKIGEAVSTLLTEPKYKKRIMEIKKENENMNAIDAIEEHILEQAALGAQQ